MFLFLLQQVTTNCSCSGKDLSKRLTGLTDMTILFNSAASKTFSTPTCRNDTCLQILGNLRSLCYHIQKIWTLNLPSHNSGSSWGSHSRSRLGNFKSFTERNFHRCQDQLRSYREKTRGSQSIVEEEVRALLKEYKTSSLAFQASPMLVNTQSSSLPPSLLREELIHSHLLCETH